MTTEVLDITDARDHYSVGDTFTLLKRVSGAPIGNSYSRATIDEGVTVTLTKVYKSSVWVRGERFNANPWDSPEVTLPVAVERISEFLGTADPNAPKPRKLGEVPEGMIATDDPRIAWIWEDAGKYATRVNHCSEYDKICDAIGIPGRIRSFTIKKEIKGFTISRKYDARSKKEAEELFAKEIAEIS